MGSKKVEYTVGYRYYLGIHMVLCHGAVNVKALKIGDKDVPFWRYDWYYPYTQTGKCHIEQYNLFGGEDGEGGIHGDFFILSDGLEPDSEAEQYLARVTHISPLPGYKGVTSILLKQMLVCMVNPYPKPWRFCVTRRPDIPEITTNTDITMVNTDMANPAMIICECLLNQAWGLGVSESDIDDTSFFNAASTLRKEGFGLAIRWDQSNTIEDFISEVCQIIDAQLTMDPVSGKFAIKLIRQDYILSQLITLGPSEIISLSDFTRPDPKDLINQVTIVFEDYQTGVQQSVTEQNTASLLLNPAVNAVQLNYPGIPTQSLAKRVAIRELAQYAYGLARCTIVANRKAASLKMGDCFILNWPDLGFESLVMRVANFQLCQSDTNWRVTLECVQDIYGMPDTVFDETDTGTLWKEPDYTALPITSAKLYELPYYLVSWFVTGDKDSDWADLPEGFGYGAVVAAAPSGVAMNYEVMIQEYNLGNEWTVNRKLIFCDYGFLSADIDDTVTQFSINIGNIYSVNLNEPALIDDEWVLVIGFNKSTGEVTCGRGCMDTVPAAHTANAIVWFTGMYNNTIDKEYVVGQSIATRLVTIAPSGKTSVTFSPQYNYVLKNRAGRPLQPANIRVNDNYRPKKITGWSSNLKWSTRDRKQTARIINDRDGSYTPEEGTTYTVKIREKLFPSAEWSDASTTTGLTDSLLLLQDKYTPQAYSLEITMWAMRENLESWQRSVITVTHSPFEPKVISMSIENPDPAGRENGDLFIIPANAATNAGWYYTYRNGSFIKNQPSTGDKVWLGARLFEYSSNTWNEVI
jgi:hypothetical protein